MSAFVERNRGLAWLTGREVLRVLKLWTQTIVAPVLSSFLFILVFGLSLNGRIHQIGDVPYDQFIVPGLITMAMVQAAYSNNSSSVFQARFDRYLHDVLSAPMRTWQVNLGLSLGGAVRAAFPPGLLIGRIVDVQQDPTAIVQIALIQPAVNLDKLELVLVMTDFQPPDVPLPGSSPEPGRSPKPGRTP